MTEIKLPVQGIGKFAFRYTARPFSWYRSINRTWMITFTVSIGRVIFADARIASQVRFRFRLFRFLVRFLRNALPISLRFIVFHFINWLYFHANDFRYSFNVFSRFKSSCELTFQLFVKLVHKTPQKFLRIVLLITAKHMKNLWNTTLGVK